jgi:hypothetical protein
MSYKAACRVRNSHDKLNFEEKPAAENQATCPNEYINVDEYGVSTVSSRVAQQPITILQYATVRTVSL